MSNPNGDSAHLSTGRGGTVEQNALATETLALAAAHYFVRTLRVPVQPDWGIGPAGACQCADGMQCARTGKHPSVRRPREKATTDLGQIEQWVRMGRNLAAVPVNYVVLDVEHKPGHDGVRPLMRWCELAGVDAADLFSTFTVRSGGGGLHLWFWLPRGYDAPKGMDGWLPDVDVKTATKISDKATIPGARHASGGRYEFEMNGPGATGFMEPRRAPAVLLDEIRAGRAWRPLAAEEWPAIAPPGGPVIFGDFIEQSLPWRRAEILPPGAERPARSAFAGMPLGSLDDGVMDWVKAVSPR